MLKANGSCCCGLVALILLTCNPAAAEEPAHRLGRVTMHIKPQLVDCTGVGPQKCMVVREDDQKRWTYFYDAIEGFKYEEGFLYVLVADKFKVENPPADGSSIRYVLVKLVNKKKDE